MNYITVQRKLIRVLTFLSKITSNLWVLWYYFTETLKPLVWFNKQIYLSCCCCCSEIYIHQNRLRLDKITPKIMWQTKWKRFGERNVRDKTAANANNDGYMRNSFVKLFETIIYVWRYEFLAVVTQQSHKYKHDLSVMSIYTW